MVKLGYQFVVWFLENMGAQVFDIWSVVLVSIGRVEFFETWN